MHRLAFWIKNIAISEFKNLHQTFVTTEFVTQLDSSYEMNRVLLSGCPMCRHVDAMPEEWPTTPSAFECPVCYNEVDVGRFALQCSVCKTWVCLPCRNAIEEEAGGARIQCSNAIVIEDDEPEAPAGVSMPNALHEAGVARYNAAIQDIEREAAERAAAGGPVIKRVDDSDCDSDSDTEETTAYITHALEQQAGARKRQRTH